MPTRGTKCKIQCKTAQLTAACLALAVDLCFFFLGGGGFRYYEKYVDLDVTLNTVEVLSKLIEVRAFLFRFVRM